MQLNNHNKIALGIEYNGSNFHGWQLQKSLAPEATLQGCVEAAVQKFAGIKENYLRVQVAGRTDKGVHAKEQVVHVDLDNLDDDNYKLKSRKLESWVFGLNRFLPNSIRVLWAKAVGRDFHARYSAKSRQYNYIIYNSHSRPALFNGLVTWVYQQLDIEKMQQAANYWLGEHDFSSFRGRDCQSKSPVREITKIKISQQKDYIDIEIIANAFLHHMVRNMVGVLITIGRGAKPVSWAQSVLAAKDRTKASITAAPDGLYLTKVVY